MTKKTGSNDTPQRKCTQCGGKFPATTQYFNANGLLDSGRPNLRATCRTCTAGMRRAKVAQARADQPLPKPEPQPQMSPDLLQQHRRELELKGVRADRTKLLEQLRLAEERENVYQHLAEFNAPAIKPREKKSGQREATAVLMASDWHIEEPVEAEKVNGLNEYNLQIADRRISRLAEGALWLLDMHRSKIKIRDMVLWLGGDLFSGYIHEDLMESAQLSPVESILWLQTRVVRLIDTLLAQGQLERLDIPCSFGNHGRTTAKRRVMMGAENSYEWLMYQWLAQRYKDEKRVNVMAPKSKHIYLKIYDFVIRFTHGDESKYQGGVGGLTIPLNKAIAQWDVARQATMTCLGHWHTYTSLPHLVINGSLIGYSPFAIEVKAAYEAAAQAYFLLDSKRGKCGDHPIWVEESSR